MSYDLVEMNIVLNEISLLNNEKQVMYNAIIVTLLLLGGKQFVLLLRLYSILITMQIAGS